MSKRSTFRPCYFQSNLTGERLGIRVELREATRKEKNVFEAASVKVALKKEQLAELIREAAVGGEKINIASHAAEMLDPNTLRETANKRAELICPCVKSISFATNTEEFIEAQELGEDFLEMIDWEPVDFSDATDDERVGAYFVDKGIHRTSKEWREEIKTSVAEAKLIEDKGERITKLKEVFNERDTFLEDLVLPATTLEWETMNPSQQATECARHYGALFKEIEAVVSPRGSGGLVGKSTSRRRRGRSLKR